MTKGEPKIMANETKPENPTLEEAKPETEAETEAKTREAATEPTKPDSPPPQSSSPKHTKRFVSKLKSFASTKKGRVVLAVLLAALVTAALMAFPTTRYAILGTVIKKDVTLVVLDSKTNMPISEAEVLFADQTATSNSDGRVQFTQVPVGEYEATVNKTYYESISQPITVSILSAQQEFESRIEATGRQVSVKVVNKISGKPLQGATVSVLSTTATTNNDGEAVIVLPASKTSEKGTVKLQDHNDQNIKVIITEADDKRNSFGLTPSGKIFFLSKRTGKLNVMSSNLDGTDPKVVVKGTGNENEYETVLLAARDWRYLALRATRDNKPKLYLVDTSNGKLSVIDEGDAQFQPVGWFNEHFIYIVDRNNKEYWEPKKQALKSFNATTGQLATLDENAGVGNLGNSNSRAYENLSNVYILDNLVVYTKDWGGNKYRVEGRKITFNSIRPGGEEKKVIKEIDDADSTYVGAVRLYKPQEIYYQIQYDYGDKSKYFEYEEGKIVENNSITASILNRVYPTFLYSPSGQQTFWSESRDGKNSLFIGEKNANNSKELTRFSEYSAYGWFGDEYILMSKEGSELYISSKEAFKPIKITDYHKPDTSFRGYGYGYGGF
jgi:hypothetical protein